MKINIALLATFLGCSLTHAASIIDFRTGDWDHSAVGGPSSTATLPTSVVTGTATTNGGWARNPTATGNGTRGYITGTTLVSPGLAVTVTSQFINTTIGGANLISPTQGTNNLRLDPPNATGWTVQNFGRNDTNTTLVEGKTLLQRYQRIDFAFSKKIMLNELRIADIDTATGSGIQTWRDTVALELWNGSAPTVAGTGIAANISGIPANTRLDFDTTSTGMSFAYVGQDANLGNFNTTANPVPDTDRNSVGYNYLDANGVDGFSIYLWNRGTAAQTGQHGVVLQSLNTSVTAVADPVPEPSSTLLVALSGVVLILRRRRNTVQH